MNAPGTSAAPRLVQLTPTGPAGVALLALSGPGTTALLQARFQPRGRWPAPGRLAVGRLVDPAGQLLDEVVLARAAEERYELGCHGGPAHLRRVHAALGAAGAVPAAQAEPGAPLRAAALAALPAASTELGAQVLLRQADGRLEAAWAELVRALGADLLGAGQLLAGLRRQARLGRALLEPAQVVLVGLPSAGKSSLLNALLGRQRALVSPRPGTTRDLVEAPAELAGLPVVLVDAAGQRETADALEAEGVRRARQAAGAAALRLVVIDAAAPTAAAWALAHEAPDPRLVVLNKVDLLGGDPGPGAPPGAVAVSARTGQGLGALEAALSVALVGPADPLGAVPCAPEQWSALETAERALAAGDPAAARAALLPLLPAPGAPPP